MTLSFLLLLITATISVSLGGLVYFTHPRRVVNQHYLLFALMVTGWLAFVSGVMGAETPAAAIWYLRWAFAFSGGIPVAVNLLRLSIVIQGAGWRQTLRRSAGPILLYAILCPLWFFGPLVRGVRMPDPDSPGSVLDAFYGWPYYVFSIYFLGFTSVLIALFLRDLRKVRGLRRSELSYVLLGTISGLVFGATLSVVLPLIRGTSTSSAYAPISAIALNVCIAYGIVSERIMAVADVMRRLLALLLLSLYLLSLYLAVWWFGIWALHQIVQDGRWGAHALATLVVVFAALPARSVVNRVASRLLAAVNRSEAQELLEETARAVQTVTTLDALLARISKGITRMFGAESVVVLTKAGAGFARTGAAGEGPKAEMVGESPLPTLLRQRRLPLQIETLERHPPHPLVKGAVHQLKEMGGVLAIGIYGKDDLEAILTMGPRPSGLIYHRFELETLVELCGSLAISIENARLYTEVEAGRRRIETLLELLPSGVIAVEHDGRIAVFNREAERISGRSGRVVNTGGLDALPAELGEPLRKVLCSGQTIDERDGFLVGDDGVRRPVRWSAAPVPAGGKRGGGAVLVVHDLTRVRQLEDEVKQKEALAKIGTLAAGLAHEIKNPLVTLKTFSQLLPSRFDDTDFRTRFAPLVGEEVGRIDRIVNDLLHLARQDAVSMTRLSLHGVLDHSLAVARSRYAGVEVQFENRWSASRDVILGNAELLGRTFEHFFANAVEAMPQGRVMLTTDNVRVADRVSDGMDRGRARTCIEIRIMDTGPGIPVEDRPHVFDPFFSRKPFGTGLGLAVAHRTIELHGGRIALEDRPSFGAVFRILLPLAPEESQT